MPEPITFETIRFLRNGIHTILNKQELDTVNIKPYMKVAF